MLGANADGSRYERRGLGYFGTVAPALCREL
jgi:hypothetical protein